LLSLFGLGAFEQSIKQIIILRPAWNCDIVHSCMLFQTHYLAQIIVRVKKKEANKGQKYKLRINSTLLRLY